MKLTRLANRLYQHLLDNSNDYDKFNISVPRLAVDLNARKHDIRAAFRELRSKGLLTASIHQKVYRIPKRNVY